MKKIYSFAAFILAINSVNAKQVSLNTAQQVAENYIQQNAKTKNLSLTLSYTEKSSAGESDYYVFDINNHSGFVIVSAEDAGHPIIGYSTECVFAKPSATENPNFYFWMEKRNNKKINRKKQKTNVVSPIHSYAQQLLYRGCFFVY